MNVEHTAIIRRYKELLAEANHQIVCYQLALARLEDELKDLRKVSSEGREDHED